MISNPIGVLCRALTLGLMFPLLAQADPASGPGPDARPQTDCGSLIKKAEASLPKMHNGVEKSAAQEELAGARTDLAKGDSTSCKTHVKNAVTAMQAK